MASVKLGNMIKEARVNADLTQEQLARRVEKLSAAELSMAERGKKDLTQTQLKQIAKATGVTQASLLNAAKGSSGAKKSSSTKKSTSSSKKSTSSAAKTSMKVTSTEKKLVELYRAANAETKKEALNVLRGKDNGSLLDDILDVVQDILDD